MKAYEYYLSYTESQKMFVLSVAISFINLKNLNNFL